MTTTPIILHGHSQRTYAKKLIDEFPQGSVVRISEPNRSLLQNAKMWAALNDISKAEPEGRKYTPEQWKSVFLHALKYEVQFLNGLDGIPFPAGFRTSKLNVKQMSELLEYIMWYGNEQGITWTNTERE